MAYETFEERYFGREKPFGKFGRETAKTGYGVVAGAFRIPTTIRKIWNKQSRIQRGEHKGDLGKLLGVAFGYIGGLGIDALGLQYVLDEATIRKNYTPAIVLGTTNLASLVWELGIKSGKRQQRED